MEKVYTKNEIESLSAKLIADMHNRNSELDITELCMLLLYGAAYVLYVSQSSPTSILPQVGSLAYNYLTSSLENRYETPLTNSTENATLPISKEGSEVQGLNREVGSNPNIQ